MEEKLKLLPIKSDFVFKLIFGDQRNADILADFLKSVLDIPDEEYDRLTIVDPHLKKESENDKYGILDVKVHTKSKNVIQVEIQVESIPDMKERVIYSQSKMITEQIASGESWAVINRVVSIIITDYTFIEGSTEYHHKFRYRSEDGTEFTGISEINTLELNKLPPETDDSDLWYWTLFIGSKSKEGLDMEGTLNMLAERNPAFRKAVGVLKELSADERNRMIYEDREKARRDIASKMNGARKEGIEEGLQKGIKEGFQKGIEEGTKETTEAFARKLLKRNRPIEEIIEDTGLTIEQIEILKLDLI